MDEKLKLENQINDLTERNQKLDDKVKELERKNHEITAHMYDAKEKVY